MNVSSGTAQRTLPQALILALLVGGTGAFLAEESRGAEADRATEAADVLPDGTVAVAAAAGSAAAEAASARAASVPRTVETLVLPHTPGSPAAPQLPARPRHARPRHRAAEEVRPAGLPDQAANRGRHRATSPLVHFGTGALDWAALARCESGGNPHITDPSGRYGGLYQFDAHTWHSLGGHGLPQNASATEQTSRAVALFHERGTSPWPVCGHRAEH
ncbi:transglycosylase family protein [Streptacidiphilus jiangxiensis]|uniref:Transglycosylase-like domain-containing protein n=1 Tax=Streptacidiphilus jiangxiensis TaxID=235985 RepID=A0A1H7FCA2_STRJI|nr:Transglycosylase-like domain-containing protein [Streptacidiphilus jiangxiensis]